MPERRLPDQPDFNRLGDLLPTGTPATAKPRGAAPGDSSSAPPSGALAPVNDLSQNLAAVWADVVGAEVAENARPVQIRDGRVVVTTSSSAWAQTLQFMSPMIAAGLNERLGEGSVEKVVFRHAGWGVFASLDARAAGGTGTTAKGRGGRGERKPAARAAPGAPPPAGDLPEAPMSSPVPAASSGALEGFSAEEKEALADLDRLPLAPATKERIREAMKAGFACTRQDSGRS